MKIYPSIPKDVNFELPCYCFDKLDGSNIRAEWTKKNGFSKYGAKERLLDPNERPLGLAVPLVESQQEELERIFWDQRWQKVVCFFEFYGPSSFAGNHLETDQFKATLIDVNPFKKGILDPRDFLKLFENRIEIPRLLHVGKVNQTFIDQVQGGTLEGMTLEGVVCKGMVKNVWKSFKIKNRSWLEKLKSFCKDDENLFRRLS